MPSPAKSVDEQLLKESKNIETLAIVAALHTLEGRINAINDSITRQYGELTGSIKDLEHDIKSFTAEHYKDRSQMVDTINDRFSTLKDSINRVELETVSKISHMSPIVDIIFKVIAAIAIGFFTYTKAM